MFKNFVQESKQIWKEKKVLIVILGCVISLSFLTMQIYHFMEKRNDVSTTSFLKITEDFLSTSFEYIINNPEIIAFYCSSLVLIITLLLAIFNKLDSRCTENINKSTAILIIAFIILILFTSILISNSFLTGIIQIYITLSLILLGYISHFKK